MLNWDTLVQERDAWVAHNFPKQRAPLDSVQGCIEEVGELTHAHLKQVQSIRGDDETHVANGKDAIGDLTVYLLGVMGHHNTRPKGTVLKPPTTADGALLMLAYSVGLLAKDTYHNDGDWVCTSVSDIVHFAELYCKLREWDYKTIVQETWDAVKQRDWIQYPDTGLPPQVH